VLQVAAEVAAPLAKTDEIVLLGGGDSNLTGELTRLVGQVPPAVHALTGVDLSKVNNPSHSKKKMTVTILYN
jgi:flotillin